MPVTAFSPDLDRRDDADRRAAERRSGAERRRGEGPALSLVIGERRAGGDRRAPTDRRLPLQDAPDHIRRAIDLIARVAEVGDLGEEELRALDTAIIRLRFALSRIEEGPP